MVYVLSVRATDTAGNHQQGMIGSEPGRYGNNIVHRITVEVGEVSGVAEPAPTDR